MVLVEGTDQGPELQALPPWLVTLGGFRGSKRRSGGVCLNTKGGKTRRFAIRRQGGYIKNLGNLFDDIGCRHHNHPECAIPVLFSTWTVR